MSDPGLFADTPPRARRHYVSLLNSICVGVATASVVVTATEADDTKAAVDHYAAMAHSVFSDSLTTAQQLSRSINTLIEEPGEATFTAAKEAWLAARIPYGQTEGYRFGNANVDDWEGKVNAWPLDEGLIDYVVDPDYESEDGNVFAVHNIISSDDAISADLLRSYHEKGGSEANVATGYHAIEFLLWGQDLNRKPGDSGTRSWTDFANDDQCTNAPCDRRATYLQVASELLVSDLEEIVSDWAPESKQNYRAELNSLDTRQALTRALFGMGSLSLGELAGERINVALLANSQEDEHSCFSDNTHIDIQANAKSIQNIYLGKYTRIDGSVLSGPSISSLVATKDESIDKTLREQLDTTDRLINELVVAAENGEHFDQQIMAGNLKGNERVKRVIDALRNQTVSIEAAAKALGITDLQPETSDSFASN